MEPLLTLSGLRHLLNSSIEFSLTQSECMSVTGSSGSGKTRLLRAIADLEKSEANINLRGLERNTIPADEWRKRVCFVPAETAWWSDQVADHFSETCPSEWLSILELDVETLDWPVARLSTGERQRLGLLRALSLCPDVLLLDEPTANLDPGNTKNVEQLVLEYLSNQSAAALWISHDQDQRNRISQRHLIIQKDNWAIIE